MSREYEEARSNAEDGIRYAGGVGKASSPLIPGLYGLKVGWVEWHPDRQTRLDRVDAHFGIESS